MYTIQKYLETNIAACVLFSTYSSPWGQVQSWVLFFKAEECGCSPASTKSNTHHARRGFCTRESVLFANEIERWGKMQAW